MKHTPILIFVLFTFFKVTTCEGISNNIPDSIQIDSLNQYAWKLRNNDIEKSKQYALLAIDKAKVINYTLGFSYSYNVLGHYYKVRGSYDSAFIYYHKSLTIRKKLNDQLIIARSYRNIMSILKLQGKINEAIQTGLLAIHILQPIQHNASAIKEKAWLQTNLSALYLKTGDYSNALKNALDSRDLFKSQDESEGLASANLTLGNIYESQKNYHKALLYYNYALKLNMDLDNPREIAKLYNNIGYIYYTLNQNKTSLEYLQKSLKIREEYGFEDDLNGLLNNLGIIYGDMKQYKLAYSYFEKSLNASLLSGNIQGQYEALTAIGLNLLNQKKYDSAIFYLKKALLLTDNAKDLPESLVLYKELSSAFRTMGSKDSALFYIDKFDQLRDSLNDNLRKSIELGATIKEKDQELLISQAANRLQKMIIATMCIALVLIGIIFLLISRSVKSKRKLVQLEHKIKEQELHSLDAMIEGQEKERKRLASELHDTLGSILSATKYAFKSMENSAIKLVEENKVQYQKINIMLDEALENVRRISHDMASGILIEEGLESALKQLCEMIEQTGSIHISLNLHGFDEKIDYTVEVNLYRIIQELLTNVLKHAQAKNVNIQLVKSKKNINLILEDDGKGFNESEIRSKKGIGQQNIANRIKTLSGTLNIDSGKGKGTIIIIDVPLNNENT